MTSTVIPGRWGATGAADFSTGGGRVQNAIANAASSTGVDFHYLYHQAKVESGLNPNARASTSSASGLYQFTSQTWLATVKQHGAEHGMEWAANAITRGSNGRYYVADETTKQEILGLRTNPEMSAAMAGEYASDNQDFLKARLGRDTNSVDLYMAHFLGPAGASRFLSARDQDGGQSAAALMPSAAHANPWVFYNKDGSARSLNDVYARFAARFEKSEGTSGTGGGTSAPVASTQQVMAARSPDTAAEIARMQLAALNGETDTDGLTAIMGGTSTSQALAAKALMSPSPQTAKLAYLMLSSLGV
jgi:hypothetical protein